MRSNGRTDTMAGTILGLSTLAVIVRILAYAEAQPMVMPTSHWQGGYHFTYVNNDLASGACGWDRVTKGGAKWKQDKYWRSDWFERAASRTRSMMRQNWVGLLPFLVLYSTN